MATYEFEVRQVAIGVGTHSWEVLEPSSGSIFALPQGGTGKLVGAYPEIEDYIKINYKKNIIIRHVPSLDRFAPDYTRDLYEWRYNRSGDEIIVRDIPRTVASISIGT